MGSALAQIIRCMRRQPVWLPVHSVEVHDHPQHRERLEAKEGIDSPNLMLWTGTSHQLVLMLKEDE